MRVMITSPTRRAQTGPHRSHRPKDRVLRSRGLSRGKYTTRAAADIRYIICIALKYEKK